MKTIIKAIIAVMIVATLSMPAMADVVINGSTSPAWQNMSMDNVTTSANNLTVVRGISFDDFNRVDNVDANANTGKIKWGESVPKATEIKNNMMLLNETWGYGWDIDLPFSSKNYMVSFWYCGSVYTLYILFYTDAYAEATTGSYHGYNLAISPEGEIYYRSKNGTDGWITLGSNLSTPGPNATYSFDTRTIPTGLKLYRNGALYHTFPANSNWSSGGLLFETNQLNLLYIDNYNVYLQDSGNLTAYHDGGSGNEVHQVDVNATTPTNTNYTVTAYNNVTGDYLETLGTGLTGNQSLTVTSKVQDYKINVTLNGNTTATPEVMQVTFWTQAVSAGNQPNITSWGNNYTNNQNLSFTINIFSFVNFNATANQIITTWNWLKNDVNQNNNYNNFTTEIRANTFMNVSGTNVNGTTNTTSWNVTVNVPPEIFAEVSII